MLKLSLLVSLGLLAKAADESAKVTSLPGQDTFDFGYYSGYLQLNGTKMLHYVFLESQNAPSTDPLVVWFNGGPGCSSMLGLTQEHGPYVMESGTDYFHPNEYSWNKFANMLYIESPAGVGFSYCNSTEDCTFDDNSSADDNLQALLEWFKSYSEYLTNDLYISGESYAGIYVPYLVDRIDTYNNETSGDKLNLVGFMVGNGVTNWKFDTTPAYTNIAYWHGLYSQEMYDEYLALDCKDQYGQFSSENLTEACAKWYY